MVKIQLLFFLYVWFGVVPTFCTQLHFIGLYNSCLGRENRTQLHIDAETVSNFNKEIIESELKKNPTTKCSYDAFDVCDNFTQLIQIVEKLVFHKRYTFDDKRVNYTLSSIAGLFTHMPLEMVTFVQSVMPHARVFNIDYRVQKDGSIFNPIDEWVQHLKKLVVSFGWKKIKLVSLTSIDFPFLSYFRKSIKALQTLSICLENYSIRPYNMSDDVLLNMELNISSTQSPIVLFGEKTLQEAFLSKVLNLLSNIPFLPITYGMRSSKMNCHRINNENAISKYDADLVTEFRLDFQLARQYYNLPGYVKYETQMNMHDFRVQIFAIDFVRLLAIYDNPDLVKLISLRFKKPLKIPGGWEIIKNGTLIMADLSVMRNSTLICEKPTCQAGHYSIYSNTSNGFSWKCVMCPENTHKPSLGKSTCQRCTGRFNIDDGKRTLCIDPFTNTHINFTDSEFIFLIIFSSIGSMLTTFSMVIFLINRTTPMVLVSDLTLSMIHMSIISLLFLTIPPTFIGKPEFLKCLSRLLSVSVLYVANVCILFIKSQKLLGAFTSNVKISTEEVKRTKLIQIFFVIVLTLIINSLLGLVSYQRPISYIETLYHDVMKSIHHCNNYLHFNVLIASTMVIQLMCSIQAFRGRNLPSVMNDGIVLMYATFTLTIVFGVSFVIINAQPPQMKELFQCIAVTINNVVIVFLMYTQKALRMLVFPERNTSTYFQRERMRERKQEIDYKLQAK